MTEEKEVVKSEPPAPMAVVEKLMEETDDDEIFVAARTLEEMNLAQTKLQAWALRRVSKLEKELVAAQENLDIAKKRHWAKKSFEAIVLKAKKEKEFYEKVHAALLAGYTIIPDMPMDIFAVRTTSKKPRANVRTERDYGGSRQTWVKPQESNSPALGEGKFVSPVAQKESEHWTENDKDGKPVKWIQTQAIEFQDAIDFPFKLAKPMVLNATARALSERFFDELGAAPQQRKGDPMVIGRIYVKNGYTTKGISFLVSWFIDSKDL